MGGGVGGGNFFAESGSLGLLYYLFLHLFLFILPICSTNVTSAPECVVYLTSKCKKLKKLFLTALR